MPSEHATETLQALASSPDAGLSSAVVRERRDRLGPNEVAERRDRPLLRFAAKFWGLSAWMLELIVVISWALGKRADMAIALALLVVNAVISFAQERRASASVEALRRRLQVTARVLRDGAWSGVAARDLVPGDVVRLRAGDFVPADALLIEGALEVDQSALTGESAVVSRGADGLVHSGSIVRRGEATAVVVETGGRTYFGRTTELVQTARPKLHVEGVIARVVRYLLLIVGTLVAVTAAYSLVRGLPLADLLPLSLVLLMSAVPVALPVMFTVSAALGAIELARQGVLITRLSAAEDAAHMDVLCADKTGTLTLNRLSVVAALPRPGFAEEDVLRDGALASHAADQDPIDLAFLRAAEERGLLSPAHVTVSFTPFAPDLRRTEALVEVSGRRLHVVKGAVRTLAALAGLSPFEVEALESQVAERAPGGGRAIAVARGEAGAPLALVGVAFLLDPPRPDSRRLIEELRGLGVGVKMLTGDALPVARHVAQELGLSGVERASAETGLDTLDRVDGLAEVLPEGKFRVVQALQDARHVVGMTGDGVNDAPALRQAEVGIAVSGATDVAKGAASAVLLTEGLAGIVDLVRIGRAVYQRLLTWIVNKVSRTILKAGFVTVALLVTGKFVISALAMVLLVFMTDFVKIALSTDRVRPSLRPASWEIGPMVGAGFVLGALMLGEALALLAVGWRWFDLGADEGRLHTFTFETLLFFALASIVSVRERGPFWATRPAPLLLAALLADAAVGAFLGLRGVASLRPLPPEALGLVVATAVLCSLGPNDLVKRALVARAGPGGPAARSTGAVS